MNMKYKSIFNTIICISLFFFISSCSTISSHLKTNNNFEHLEEAVTKLWDARIKQDWNTVYLKTDTTYKSKTPKEKFVENCCTPDNLPYCSMKQPLWFIKHTHPDTVTTVHPIPGPELEAFFRFQIPF